MLTSMASDLTPVYADGPWTHRDVSANGARFHVVELGDGPLALFLHGFPQFWWTWREQLTAFADAGYRAVAMDLRGIGGSDKPPRGYDPLTATMDVTGVIRALGESNAVLVGHGLGAGLAWRTTAPPRPGCWSRGADPAGRRPTWRDATGTRSRSRASRTARWSISAGRSVR